MNKLLTILFSIFSIACFSQGTGGKFPVNSTNGTAVSTNLTRGVAAADSAFQFSTNYADTTTANFGFIRLIPGGVIRVAGTQFWVRNQTVNAWVQVTGGGGGGSTITSIGNGFKIGVDLTNNTKSVFGTQGVTLDSTSNANAVSFKLGELNSSSSTASIFTSTRKLLQDTFRVVFQGPIPPSIPSFQNRIEIRGSDLLTHGPEINSLGGMAINNYLVTAAAPGFPGLNTYIDNVFNLGIGYHFVIGEEHAYMDMRGSTQYFAFETGSGTSMALFGTALINHITQLGLKGKVVFGAGLAHGSILADVDNVGSTMLRDSVSIWTRPSVSSTDSVLVKSGLLIKAIAQSSLIGVNIYNSNGTLAGARTVTGGGNSLTFTGISDYRISATTTTIASSVTSGSVGSSGVILDFGQLSSGYGQYIFSNSTAINGGILSFIQSNNANAGSTQETIGQTISITNSGTLPINTSQVLLAQATGGINTALKASAIGSGGINYSAQFLRGAVSLGTAGTESGRLEWNGSVGGVMAFIPNSNFSNFTLTWPADDGTLNQVLTTDGTGTLTWTTPSASVLWNNIGNPTGTQTLTFDDGELNAWTISSDAETFWTKTANSITSGVAELTTLNGLTSGTGFRMTTSSTALAANNELLDLQMSGANAGSSITATGARISVTNTGTTNTNIGLDVTSTGGSSDNWAIAATGNIRLTSANTTQATTSSSFYLNPSALTSGTAMYAPTATLTSGNLIQLVSTSTALAANNEALDISLSGANASNAITATGIRISVTNTNGTSGTNTGINVTASGATTNNIGINSTPNVIIGAPTMDANNPLIAQSRTNTGTDGFRIYLNNGTANTNYGAQGLLASSSYVVDAPSGYGINFSGTRNFTMLNTRQSFFGGTTTTPTAIIHLAAGTTSIPPLRFTSGSLATAGNILAGNVEFLTDKYYATITTGTAVKEITLNDAALTSGTTPVATTNGRLTDGLIFAQGTYTPTLSNTTNVTSSTPVICHYIRIGNQVTVTGSAGVVTTLAVATVLSISLPVSSNFATATDAAGLGQATSAIATNAYVQGNITSDLAELTFIGLSVGGNGTIYFTFTYTII